MAFDELVADAGTSRSRVVAIEVHEVGHRAHGADREAKRLASRLRNAGRKVVVPRWSADPNAKFAELRELFINRHRHRLIVRFVVDRRKVHCRNIKLLMVVDDPRERGGERLRTPRYRFTEWNDGRDGIELYDHDDDPHEYKNLAADPQQASTISELRQLLRDRWAK